MKNFMCIVLAIVLVIMCGCSVARLYLEITNMQAEKNMQDSPTTPAEAVPTPVYTYEHTAWNVFILESNTSTGEVKYATVCPRCGALGDFQSGRFVERSDILDTIDWCSECQLSFRFRIGVIIHIDYQ